MSTIYDQLQYGHKPLNLSMQEAEARIRALHRMYREEQQNAREAEEHRHEERTLAESAQRISEEILEMSTNYSDSVEATAKSKLRATKFAAFMAGLVVGFALTTIIITYTLFLAA